jgi:Rrf2 family iron-sulfur cluster assembly transcriptional regulator
MILGTRARYAVMAMVDLAAHADGGRPVRLTDIAQRQQIPLPYLEQIFARLKKSGLLESVKGPGGGYRLAHAAGDTDIAAIVLAADESLKMTRCNKHSANGCMSGGARCLTHDLWEGLGEQIEAYLRGVTLADVLARRGTGMFVPPVGAMESVREPL